MKTTHRLVVQSAVLGSLLLSVFGFFVVPAKATIHGEKPIQGAADILQPRDFQNKDVFAHAPIEQRGCGLNKNLPEKVYRWCDLIHEHAERAGLMPDLVAAVVLVESAGEPLAYSHSGAVGLMQVMPRDGLAAAFECVNGPCFSSRPTRRELEDPAFNVTYGTNMLAGLIQKHGDIRKALRAYGPMDVDYDYADKVLSVWERYTR
jgi:hypothetical protein